MKREPANAASGRAKLIDGPAMPAQRDFVDHLIEEWKSQAPYLNVTPFAIIVRMKRATVIFDRARERMGAPYRLGAGEIMVLDALRRAGPPNRLNPGRLLEELLTPSGTMTSWIDRLAKRGFVKRMPDPDDRRGVLVQLAPRGRRVVGEIDTMTQAHWRGMPEHGALAGMSPEDLNTLADLLRKLALALENAPCHTLKLATRPAGTRKAGIRNARKSIDNGLVLGAGRQGGR
ncbi:MAG TPA: MarR family transcriptional regulator [Candidatus Binataceae bacterium]|nr:MarR family transcriptional regulator [Candidatus Binataceae bacterium]